MIPSGDPSQRPAMRRKSSAQNLLSSFKSTPSQIQTSGAGSPSLPTAIPAALSGSTTPLNREWDSQSLQSDVLSGVLPINANANGGGLATPLPQGTSVEYLRDLVQKRMITITYMRNVHEG